MSTRRSRRTPLPERVLPGFEAPVARAPLAARLRPRDLDEMVGQTHLVGPAGPLRRMVEAGRLASMLLWGAPGVGKTSLARLLAESVESPFRQLSAVMSGVAEVRAVVADARAWLDRGGGSSVLFIDEIHRFNRAQQDALLPHVEDGTLTLIGATTENPYFEVNAPLLSRLRVFRLEPLSAPELAVIIERALVDERGLADRVGLGSEALEHLVDVSAGDARVALNVLEAAVTLKAVDVAAAATVAGAPRLMLALADIESAAQQRILAYDRAGDGHYGTVSAFIKSVRGNDPDAALYWLATMVEAGEDPRFIARRLIICAGEDVGNADPRALQVAVAAAQALDFVGMPEARYALAQATVYLATAPKSDRSGKAYWSALEAVRRHGSLPVPGHLLPASHPGLRQHGIGVGYRYPHDHEGGDVEQQYLPDALVGQRYYVPSRQGWEVRIAERMEHLARARRQARDDDAGVRGGRDAGSEPRRSEPDQ